MKTVFICLAIAGILIASCNVKKEKKEKTVTADAKNTVLQNIHNRKSVRDFERRKMISKEDLTTLVKAGMAAPSAGNKQPWEFIAVSDSAVLNMLSQKTPQNKMLRNAGGAILVCGNSDRFFQGELSEFWVQDCSAATQNILLAVESMQLGAVWTAVYPNMERVNQLRESFNLPETVIPMSLVIIGYPEGKQTPKDKWKENYLHWEKW
ncbi:MAG: nitroreductase family protein [Prevotellaceae bacterium]|jgi:nitroreductase|nr:nitroreductase family protein [Prevotellaceae bacterium]